MFAKMQYESDSIRLLQNLITGFITSYTSKHAEENVSWDFLRFVVSKSHTPTNIDEYVILAQQTTAPEWAAGYNINSVLKAASTQRKPFFTYFLNRHSLT